MKQYCKYKIFAVFIMTQRITGGGKNLKNSLKCLEVGLWHETDNFIKPRKLFLG